MTEMRARTLHPIQLEIAQSTAKRKVVKAGRRAGKTVLAASVAASYFLRGKRPLYTAPTTEQLGRFWVEVVNFFYPMLQAKVLEKNEQEHTIEVPRGQVVEVSHSKSNQVVTLTAETRIKAKTAWNADTLRGDYADLLILDEFQLTNEDAWGTVGAPMLLDTNGDALFLYTPPSLHSRSVSKANDPMHAAKLYRRARQMMEAAILEGKEPRWRTWTFASLDNPYLSKEALDEITGDMTSIAYRMEILAEDIDEAPGALWTRATIEAGRVVQIPTTFDRIVVAVDPSATSGGDAAGIVVEGKRDDHYYTLADHTLQGSPMRWAQAAVLAYYQYKANLIVAESNNGGEMVSQTIKTVDNRVPVKLVTATRGKQVRAEPVAAIYEQGRAHHVGSFPALEDEMCIWIPGDPSPNRMDALVWAITELNVDQITLGVI